MRDRNRCFILVFVAAVGLVSLAAGQKPSNPRPGDQPFTPTRLEWAALGLQASERGGSIVSFFLPDNDGRTVVCVATYPASLPAENVVLWKNNVKLKLKVIQKEKGWDWLSLRFEERTPNQ